MDWWLVYRDEDQMRALTAEIDPSSSSPSVQLFRDSVDNVIYLSLDPALTRRLWVSGSCPRAAPRGRGGAG